MIYKFGVGNMTEEKKEKELMVLLEEKGVFKPSDEFVNQTNIKKWMNEHNIKNYGELLKKAADNPEWFWDKMAEELSWYKKWDKVLSWEPPFVKWFINGKLNVSYNCVDRHLVGFRKNKAAIIWENELGHSRILTYQQLYNDVSKFANVLKDLGIEKGDIVTMYLPMIPELAISMLACARIGAIHNVVFGGFSSESLKERINDSESKLLITSDGAFRRGKLLELKKNADRALEDTPSIDKVVVVKYTGRDVSMLIGRDVWWDERMSTALPKCEPVSVDSEDILFILYTSGTTGKPKGVVHTTGGYLTGVYTTTKWVFDLKEEDTFWCTADIGWITGHSYIVYGPLASGTTTLMYDGAPDYPKKDRLWEIIEKYRVNIFYTAPTTIRMFMRWSHEWERKRDLSSLRLLGSVGEPINPEAWLWYHENIGSNRCPIVDTWWQTETGMILITPLPGITNLKPGSATTPFPSISAKLLDDNGKQVPFGEKGSLAIDKPWPAMCRTLYKDPGRYVKNYWGKWKNDIYFTGDGATMDEDGYFWIAGRIDDVMNVAGHRLSTMELESALVDHHSVAESAVVAKPDKLKGQVPIGFIILKDGIHPSKELAEDIRNHVGTKIGPIAKPQAILFTPDLPKTRSGKIMRRILRNLVDGKERGDTTTLRNPAIVDSLEVIIREELKM